MEKHKQAASMLCEYLRKLMQDKGITQEVLAHRTGLKQSDISRMLSGKQLIRLDRFILLADAINCYFFVIDKDEDDDLTQLMKDRWRRQNDTN